MDSITIYYKENSGASAKAIKWFEEHHFTINLKKINTITHKEIFQTIYLAELDIPDILRKPKGYSLLLQKKKKKLNKLRFAESLKFLEFHTELLETPIILSNKHSLLGYDEQKLNALFCDRY